MSLLIEPVASDFTSRGELCAMPLPSSADSRPGFHHLCTGACSRSPFELAWTIRPLEAVGGDFIVAVPLTPKQIFLALGDVMGHGAKAHRIALRVRRALHGLLRAGEHSPAVVLGQLHSLVSEVFPVGFVTAVACVLDMAGTVTWSAAGHPPALVRSPQGRVTWLTDGFPPLGLGKGDFQEQKASLIPGSSLLFYSDGVADALGVDNAEKARELTRLLDRTAQHGVRTIVRAVSQTARHRVRQQNREGDDQAVLAACVS